MKILIDTMLLNCFWSNFEQDIQKFKPYIIWFDIHWDITVWIIQFQLVGVEWVEIENNGRVDKTYECWHTQLLEVIFNEESKSSLILPLTLILVEIWDEIN